jgi:mRNA-degrading endonuclease RelE of RelBE toxin-antitoxin system
MAIVARTPHKWLLVWTDEAREQLAGLSPKNRARVFDCIADIAKAEDPGRAPGAGPYKAERKDNVWKARQGDYRIFFTFKTGELVHLKFRYKGRLYIVNIRIHHTGYDRD